MKKKTKLDNNLIIQNKNIRNKYFIEKEIESGISLKGWEVKSIRSRKVNINDSYIIFKKGVIYLLGIKFQPIYTIFNYENNLKKTHKLLLSKNEINYLYGIYYRKQYSIVALSMYWKKIWIKIKIGIVKGKKKYDKRLIIKNREWKINKQRIIKYLNK